MAQIDRSEGLVGNTFGKAPVRAATIANISLSGEQTIDGIACVAGDRILVKNQTTGSDNGIWVVSTGTWNRSADFDGPYDVSPGTMVTISEGTQAETYWIVSTTGAITIGTTSISFVQANHIETDIHGATNKTTPVGADEIPIWDSVSGLLNKLSFTNLVTYLRGLCSAGWNALTSSSCTGNAATATTAGNGVPAGTIIDFAGTVAPSGYLACPTSAGGGGLVSRTTYAALFTAIGTTWGVGDGSTTFQIPWFTADTVGVQANANVGTTTHGAVLDHIHNTAYTVYNNSGNTGLGAGASSITMSVIPTTVPTTNHNATDNLASGSRVLKCVKY